MRQDNSTLCAAWTLAALLFGVLSPILNPVRRAAAAEADDFQVPSGERQLFLDDRGLAKIENLARTMHRPMKRGAVIRGPDPKKTIQTRTAPVWDPNENLYKTWAITIDENLWQSRDGLHWQPGPKTNMRITMAVYDSRETDEARRFKAPLLNRGLAVSADGVAWSKLDLPKIPSSDEGNFSFDADEGLFIHTVKRGGNHGRSVAIATSRDFMAWDDYGVVFQSDDRDQELGKAHIKARMADATLNRPPYDDPSRYNVDVYNMGVFRYEGVYIGLPAMYHATGPVPNYPNTVGFHLVQLAFSRDLKHWHRLGNRKTFIGPSQLGSGAYDLTQILPPSAPIIREDELWFYYTGLKWRGSLKYVGEYPNGTHVSIRGKDQDGGAICLAVLRRDGFISLDADQREGVVETQPFKLPTGNLHVNADVFDGALRVEVLNEQRQVVANSKPVNGDLPRAEIEWESGDLAGLADQTVSLRFRLRKGSIYSYWLTK